MINNENINILNLALKIFQENYICDHCLGRQFSKLLTGYSNNERGLALRTTLMMMIESNKIEINNDNISKNLKKTTQEKCWVCQDIFKDLNLWKDKSIFELNKFEYNTFLVGTKLNGLLSENEEVLWELCSTNYSEPLKSELNRELGKLIYSKVGKDVDFIDPDITITLDLKNKDINLKIKSLYIVGYYNKYKRGIPQTQWSCRCCNGNGCKECSWTGNKYSESVSELISPFFIKYSKGTQSVFHGAGREDVDALMLGIGRPFVLEIKDPKIRNFDLNELELQINSSFPEKIKISMLKYCSKDTIKYLKTKSLVKRYNLKVKFETYVSFDIINKALFLINGQTINQKTPKRVLHRRADIVRERKVHSIKLESLDITNKYAFITIECDGGLYIKELISGDDNRTKPNLSNLIGCSSVVEELDVVNIENIQL